ncbi:zinc finger-containing protein [Scheffersomyces stipitis CBS 6054]|uniref:Zinc finger-containing protein n=1 Tax=Scheffersomyces stipitis (strain ATCC 58785 / CBS 6054 / NBRC 10063 / NRRL Y-11545) TaxID=322104 RepID=A3LYJ7_PICST|nr:zinc finger-containing protein [Scheffersomyces stipitis CBS 6054]ABN67650.1 zinc finger-containing protein [Scheffersomyces stipitis CBS 6054]
MNVKMKSGSPLATSFTPSSTSSSTSDLADLKGDLLADLWQTSSPGSYAPGTTWNFASSPPLFNQHQPVTVQKEYFQQPNLVPNSNINNTLTEENLMFNTEVDPLYMESRKQVYQDQPQEEVFNFEEQQQLQQSVVRPNQPQSNFAYHSKNQQQVNTQLYKTELCVSFMKMGICPYGNKCQFAHGENELKTVERPPKWRSKPCANWAKLGSCRYGNRCCFKHGD